MIQVALPQPGAKLWRLFLLKTVAFFPRTRIRNLLLSEAVRAYTLGHFTPNHYIENDYYASSFIALHASAKAFSK